MSALPPSGHFKAWPFIAAMLGLIALAMIAWSLQNPPSVRQDQAGTTEVASPNRPPSAAEAASGAAENAPPDTVTTAPTASTSSTAEQIKPPGKPKLPDFSKRDAHVVPRSPPQLAALDTLRNKVPGITVDFDPLSGAPSNIVATGKFLSKSTPTRDDVNAPVKEFIDANAHLFGHDASAFTQTRVTREDVSAHNGMRTTVWQQEVDGIPLYNTILKASVTKDGALVALGSHFLQDAAAATGMDVGRRAALVAQPPINVNQAVSLAAANLGDQIAPEQAAASSAAEGPERKQRFSVPLLSDTMALLAWLPMNATTSRLTWDVTLMSLKQNEMFRVLVDAQTGEVLMRTSLTSNISDASYRVYADETTLQPFDSPAPMSPGLMTPASTQAATVSRNLITTQALDATASPNGWMDDGGTATYGNNVDSHLDLSNTNPTYGTGTHATSATRNFDFTMDLALAPSTYQDATVTQLFYLCNWYHDKMYEFGFTESAGNFQQTNFGRGGFGNDAVLADAQDGDDTDNASFSTPSDGSPGRMQMYVFTGPSPARDGALDAEIVLHEYTHGLSSRLVGGGAGMSQLQSKGMGEGWSDFYSMCLLSQPGDAVNGNYAAGSYATYQLSGLTENYYYGIRRYPYSTDLTINPLTLKDIDPTQASSHAGVPQSPIIGSTANELHNMGEVWCVALWDARANLVNKLGAVAGNQMMLQLVTDGMKLSPVDPTYLQARDYIIQADLVNNGGSNYIELWAAFAKRGMGATATVPASSTSTGVVESYDIPDDLAVSPVATFASAGQVGGPFTPSSSIYTLINTGVSSMNWTASTNQTWLGISSSSGTLAAGANTTVTVSLANSANTLAAGTHSATTTFTNVTSGATIPRATTLTAFPPRAVLFDLNSDPGWTRQGEWAFGTPTGGGGATYGQPDPTSGATGTNVFGVNLNGDYSTSAVGGPYYLTTSAIDLTNKSSCQLRFKRWLNTDWYGYANATIQVSNNGTIWTSVYQNPAALTTDSAWTTVTYDISAVADNHSTVFVRWGYQIVTLTDLYPLSGWNLDDIEILGTPLISLAMSLSTNTVTEGDAAPTGTITVTPIPESALVVSLASSDATEAAVPATVTIPAGQTSVTFPFTVSDDLELDGTQYATITATASGYPDASAVIAVQDNEHATLGVTGPATTNEGAGTVQGTVTVSAAPDTAVSVSLSSSDTSAAQTPATVTVPAGQTSAPFTITIVDDNKINGTHALTITAHVANWTDGTATINISDNEATSLAVTLPAQVIEGGTGSGTVSISGTLTTPLTVSMASDTPRALPCRPRSASPRARRPRPSPLPRRTTRCWMDPSS